MPVKIPRLVVWSYLAAVIAGLTYWSGETLREGFATDKPAANNVGTEPGTLRFAAGPPTVTTAEDHERQHTESRSSHWPKVRAAHLAKHPTCEACGAKAKPNKALQAHHIIPFHNDPAKELDPDNLITLCIDGVGHCDCHLLIGHAGNFKCHNENVLRDAKRFREMLAGQTCDPKP